MPDSAYRYWICAVLTGLLAPDICYSASADPLAGLSQTAESARAQWNAPGLAAAVVKDDRVVFMQGFGVRNLGQDSPVDVHTAFTIASTTKAFVAVALGMLVDDGKLDWDDPIVKHLPEFRVADPRVTLQATIRDALTHRTGIAAENSLWFRGFDRATLIHHMRYAEQDSPLGATFDYNNLLYIVAAEIVARVAGMSFEDFIRQRIFSPLEMTDSFFHGPERNAHTNVAGAHMRIGDQAEISAPFNSKGPMGAAGINSSAADMTQWLRFLLNKGNYGDRALIDSATLAEIFKPQMLVPMSISPAAQHANVHFLAYGFGWLLQNYKGRLLAMHTGSLQGASALVAIVPEEKLGLVILINADHVEYRQAFMYDVLDRYFGERNKDWNGAFLKLYGRMEEQAQRRHAEILSSRVRGTHPSFSLQDYTSTFEHPLAGDAVIALQQNGELSLLMSPDGSYSLYHWNYDTFQATHDVYPHVQFFLTFTQSMDGKITGFLKSDGRHFMRDAQE
jgi:CubicO group peptidase (beta-lactamase class C family)